MQNTELANWTSWDHMDKAAYGVCPQTDCETCSYLSLISW